MSIATRTGDGGTTTLLHGQRVSKDHPQIEALGACDELNVEIGGARLLATDPDARALLAAVQGALVALMGEVACAQVDAARHEQSTFARLSEQDLLSLDAFLGSLESEGVRLDGWATPGANPLALGFDRARVTARRAERSLALLSSNGRTLRPLVLQWINRLSDLLWLMARQAESAPPRADA